MKSRILGRPMVLVALVVTVIVVLFTSGAFAQGTASIKALFTQDTTAVTSAPAGQEQPISPRE